MAKKDDIEKIIELAEGQLGNRATKYRTWFYGYDAEDVAWCAIFRCPLWRNNLHRLS